MWAYLRRTEPKVSAEVRAELMGGGCNYSCFSDHNCDRLKHRIYLFCHTFRSNTCVADEWELTREPQLWGEWSEWEAQSERRVMERWKWFRVIVDSKSEPTTETTVAERLENCLQSKYRMIYMLIHLSRESNKMQIFVLSVLPVLRLHCLYDTRRPFNQFMTAINFSILIPNVFLSQKF